MGIFGKNKSVTKVSDSVESGSIVMDNGETYDFIKTVDCSGFSCPRPQLMTKATMSSANSGDIVRIKVDNPTSMESLQSMQDELDSQHLGTVFSDKSWEMLMKKN